MIHAPISSKARLRAGKLILGGIVPLFHPEGRLLFPRNSPSVASSATPSIFNHQFLGRPFIFRAVWVYCSVNPNAAIDCDILLSADDRTDAGAAIRDQRLTNVPFAGGYLVPNLTPTRYALNYEARRWYTFIKTLFRNQTGAPVFMHMISEIELA
jgi:hypothetical protein